MLESVYTSSKRKLTRILETARKEKRPLFHETLIDENHNIYIIFYTTKGGHDNDGK